MDSASAACRRNPAYCATGAGEEMVVPLQVRAAQVGAARKAWAEFEESERKSIENLLVQCAQRADAEVNRKEFGGRHPTREECEKQVGGSRENPITRAMRLGNAKHALALQCTQEKLGLAHPGRFSLEQRYRTHPDTRQLQRITAERALESLRNGGRELSGTVVPDVVIHTGDPIQVQRVYDFKFPCPESNPPSWRQFPPGNPHGALNQGVAYRKTFGTQPRIVTPHGAVP
jgi:rRNA maturation protein Nop10